MAEKSSEFFGVSDNQAGAAPQGPCGDSVGGDPSRVPPEPPQRSSSAHRARAERTTPRGLPTADSYRRPSLSTRDQEHVASELAAKDAAAAAAALKEREERIRILKEKQKQEQQRKLEELKLQAEAAQRFREEKEKERQRRIEEQRQRGQDHRTRVEERRRQIWEADREKRELLIKKTQEREARLEAKRRNERSGIVFAFGSSTPRMLEPSDTGGSYWGTRRATSTSNVMFSGSQLTRRSSERELGDLGLVSRKQRATSAHALDRKPGEDVRMSSSMYEVFHWDLDTEPPLTAAKPPRPPAPLSLPPQNPPYPQPVPVPRGRKSPAPRLPGKALSLPPQSPPPLSPVHPTAAASDRGDDDLEDGVPGNPSSRARRKTDLMPTIPTNRDSSRSRHRSPGTNKSQSLSHLNLLSNSPRPAPRKSPQLLVRNLGSLSRSTGTLHKQQSSAKSDAATASAQQQLRKTRATQSMSHLAQSGNGKSSATPVAPPRMTRAERLRQKARQIALANKEKAEMNGTHRNLGADTATSVPSSRPQSAMSETRPIPTASVQMRPRPPARKPRPVSIGVSGLEIASDALKLSKTPVCAAVGDQKDNNRTAPVPPRQRKSSAPNSKLSTDSNKRTPSRSKEKLTPRATPLVSPASEQPPTPIVVKEEMQAEEEQPEKQDEMKPEVITPPESTTETPTVRNPSLPVNQQSEIEQQATSQTNEELPECDMTVSMLAKQRINTEEEAKAALAERRRLAREQLEREAELERQRQEEEARLEEERMKQEEEDARRQEEEQERLAEEARKAEEQRLQEAIEEAKRREKEEELQREEEARLRKEREELERKQREEAEKQRKEMDEKLKQEEAERKERKRRVEAIMSRTRRKADPQKEGDEEGGKVSPSEMIEQQTQQQQQSNGGNSFSEPPPTNGPSNEPSNGQPEHTNGHHPQLHITDDLLGMDLSSNKTTMQQFDIGIAPNKMFDFDGPPPTIPQENGVMTDLLS